MIAFRRLWARIWIALNAPVWPPLDDPEELPANHADVVKRYTEARAINARQVAERDRRQGA